MEEKIERPKRVLNYESTSLGFLQYVDKLEAYANKLEAKINYTPCCKSDSEQLKCEHKYGQLKNGTYTCFDCGHEEEW